ncbi:uncharacterized protein PHALS_03735 [Plasmopara halstedii]|uniref:Uncharacterized protein n=1 Tax=Plasmopara halstedii TaxID=4781 RepID=A0A0P1AXA0_PLAHL|nr:uncharacterized protein PHALS_03735 [Plasmopara halstedii]CEG47074.1 hypothetical protein PHALS_03735 [Plasmopara halstedii]|eukprot:XP_024583443.1 hypothetical protein PHALS_03735 [Plasmopara halstedii]
MTLAAAVAGQRCQSSAMSISKKNIPPSSTDTDYSPSIHVGLFKLGGGTIALYKSLDVRIELRRVTFLTHYLSYAIAPHGLRHLHQFRAVSLP